MSNTEQKFDARSNVARSSRQYRNSWLNHINELTSVLYESDIPESEWDVILLPLRNAVETGTRKLAIALGEQEHD